MFNVIKKSHLFITRVNDLFYKPIIVLIVFGLNWGKHDKLRYS